jgi:hypothetical protein
MPGDTKLLLVFGGLHLVALLLAGGLLLLFMRSDTAAQLPPHEDGGGGGNDRVSPAHPSGPGGTPLPLPDALPARVRLRAPGRLADLLPRRERRPAREPAPRTPRVPTAR